MTTTEIILTILGSSVISTILASWFNNRLHEKNYKKEYYKKILDKRIRSYEKVNYLITDLSALVQMEGYVIHGAVASEFSFNRLCNIVRDCINETLWLSSETSHLLTELNVFLINEFSNKIADDWKEKKKNTHYRDIARNQFIEIKRLREEIRNSVENNIKNLYQIENFFNESTVPKDFPLQNRQHKNPSDLQYYEN